MGTWIKIVNNDKKKKEIDLKSLKKAKATGFVNWRWGVREREESHMTLSLFLSIYLRRGGEAMPAKEMSGNGMRADLKGKTMNSAHGVCETYRWRVWWAETSAEPPGVENIHVEIMSKAGNLQCRKEVSKYRLAWERG